MKRFLFRLFLVASLVAGAFVFTRYKGWLEGWDKNDWVGIAIISLAIFLYWEERASAARHVKWREKTYGRQYSKDQLKVSSVRSRIGSPGMGGGGGFSGGGGGRFGGGGASGGW